MASIEFGELSPQVLFEFDERMVVDGSGDGMVADFYASGSAGEIGYLADVHWMQARTITRDKALPDHIKELLHRSRGDI